MKFSIFVWCVLLSLHCYLLLLVLLLLNHVQGEWEKELDWVWGGGIRLEWNKCWIGVILFIAGMGRLILKGRSLRLFNK